MLFGRWEDKTMKNRKQKFGSEGLFGSCFSKLFLEQFLKTLRILVLCFFKIVIVS